MRVSKNIPKAPLELERFYIETIEKLKNTETTLYEESLKEINRLSQRTEDLTRKLKLLASESKNNRTTIDRQSQENRILKAQLLQMDQRITALEREIP